MTNSTTKYVPKSSRLAYRLVAYFLSFLTLFSPVMPSVAAILESSEIEANFTNHPLFKLLQNNSDFKYAAPDFIGGVSPIGMNMELFHEDLKNSNPSALGEPTYIPIAVGDITTFIPVNIIDKRIGDHTVQARYIHTQINALLGRTLIDGGLQGVYFTEGEQLDTLYQNAKLYAATADAKKFGQPLGLDQNGAVANDMVWPELRTINSEQVLVPVVYLSQNTIDTREVNDNVAEFGTGGNFGSISLNNAAIKFQRDTFLNVSRNVSLQNNAAIYVNGNLNASVGGSVNNDTGSLIDVTGAAVIETNGNVTNGDGSTISIGDTAMLRVGGAFNNLSGTLEANGDLAIGAQSITNQTVVHRTELENGHYSTASAVARIDSTTGHVVLRSGGDIVFAGGQASAGTEIQLAADGSIWIGSAQVTADTKSGKNTYTSLTNITSSLTAKDMLKLMANGEIVIDAANLVSDQGHIELLAGMGITIEDDLNSTQSYFKGKFGNTTVEESVYKTVAMRAALDAGMGIRIHSEMGDITLKAAEIQSKEGTSVSATQGGVNMLMTVENDQYSYSSVKESTFTITNRNYGHNIETGIPNTIIGGFAVEALKGVQVEYEGDPELTLDEQVAHLSSMPGLEWMGTVRQDFPDADWTGIDLAYEEWNKTSRSLSPAAMAVLSIAIAVTTGNIGFIEALSATGPFGTAMAAGASTLISQVALATVNGGLNGDIGGALEDLASSETLKSLAISMVTAGAISQLDAKFFGEIAPDKVDSSLLFKASDKLSFAGQVTQAVTQATVKAGVSGLINGGNSSDFEEMFTNSLFRYGIDAIGETMAKSIKHEFDINGAGGYETAMKYLSHAATGCIIGAATAENDNTASSESGCASGAGGAVVGELIGSIYRSTAEFEDAQSAFDEFVKDNADTIQGWIDDGKSDAFITKQLSSDVAFLQNYDRLTKMRSRGVDIAKLGGAIAAFIAGAEAAGINISSATAENAAKNNVFGVLTFKMMLEGIEILKTAHQEAPGFLGLDTDYEGGGTGLSSAKAQELVEKAGKYQEDPNTPVTISWALYRFLKTMDGEEVELGLTAIDTNTITYGELRRYYNLFAGVDDDVFNLDNSPNVASVFNKNETPFPAFIAIGENEDINIVKANARRMIGSRLTAEELVALDNKIQTDIVNGVVVNISEFMSKATVRSIFENDNFLSDFNRYLQERSAETNGFEDWSAETSVFSVGIAEGIGRSFETAVDWDAPPQLRHSAQRMAMFEALSAMPIGYVAKALKGSHQTAKLQELAHAIENVDVPTPSDLQVLQQFTAEHQKVLRAVKETTEANTGTWVYQGERRYNQDLLTMKQLKGNSDIAPGLRSDAETLGNAWVNGGNVTRFELEHGGYGLTDGARTFRLQYKPKDGIWKANFQENTFVEGRTKGIEVKNVHMNITDMEAP